VASWFETRGVAALLTMRVQDLTKPPKTSSHSRGHHVDSALSIRRQRNLIVDQRIECGLDVDLGVDHPGLLQRQPGGKN
jgi:hypothetical protein